jgi:hypothetical protein
LEREKKNTQSSTLATVCNNNNTANGSRSDEANLHSYKSVATKKNKINKIIKTKCIEERTKKKNKTTRRQNACFLSSIIITI